MMIFDEKNGIAVKDGLICFAVGCGPCCEGKIDLTVQEALPVKIEDLKSAHVTLTRADLIKLKTVIDALLAK